MTEPLEFSPASIRREFREEGRTYTPADIIAEYDRRSRDRLRVRESLILAAAQLPAADACTVAVAGQIRDHRSNGNYTTQG